MNSLEERNLLNALVERLRSSPDYREAQKCYVSIYGRSQHYGGPEEGGWWYTICELQGSIPFVNREQAEAFLDQATKEVEQKNRESAPHRYRAMERLPDPDLEACPVGGSEGYIPAGWTDGLKLWVCIEDRMGQNDNTQEPTPHYE